MLHASNVLAFVLRHGPLTLCTFHEPFRSLANTELCGLVKYGRGTYTAEGITKLCEAMQASKTLTSLKCVSLESQRQIASWPIEHFDCFCALSCGSMDGCYIGVEGGKAFAEALPKSSLTSLKCAAAHVLAFPGFKAR